MQRLSPDPGLFQLPTWESCPTLSPTFCLVLGEGGCREKQQDLPRNLLKSRHQELNQSLGTPAGSSILRADLSETVPLRREVLMVGSQAARCSASCTCDLTEPSFGPVRWAPLWNLRNLRRVGLRPRDSQFSAHTPQTGAPGRRNLAECP